MSPAGESDISRTVPFGAVLIVAERVYDSGDQTRVTTHYKVHT